MSQTVTEIKNKAGELGVISSVQITPEVASELLTLNNTNRPLRKRTVLQYAEEMKKGNWHFNGDSIRLSKDGKLLDGQHRLSAIIDSGIPQLYNIQTGLDEETFAVMDIGKNRTAGDVLSIEGYTNTNTLAGAIRNVIWYDSGRMAQADMSKVGGKDKITSLDILNWMKTNGSEEMHECVQVTCQMYNKVHIISPSVLASFLYMFGRLSVEKAKEFFDTVVTGRNISIEENHVLFLLREKLINMNLNRKMYTSREKFALIIKGWNAWITGKPVQRLTFKADEAFPTIVNA